MNPKSLNGAYLLVGGKALSAMIGLGSMLILARLLTPEDYGLVVLVEAAATLLAAVTELQMVSVLIHLPKVGDEHLNTAWTLNLIRAFVLCLLVVLIAPGLAEFYNEPRLLDIAYVSSLSMFLGALINPKMALLIRDLEFKKEFYLHLSQKIVGFMVTVGVAYFTRNYWALVLGTLASQLCGFLMSYWCYPFRPSFSLSKVRDLWGYSVWLSLANFVKTLNTKQDQFLIGKVFSTRTSGLYAMATRLSTVLFTDTLGASIRVVSPSLRAYSQDRLAMGAAYLYTQSLVTLVFLPVAGLVSALAPAITDLILGPKWVEVTDVFRFLSLALCLEAMGGVSLSVVMATLNTRLAFIRDLASLIIRAACMAFGLYVDGFIGLLIGRAVSSIFDLLLYFAIASKVTGLHIRKQALLSWRTWVASATVYPLMFCLQDQVGTQAADSKLIAATGLLSMFLFGLLMHASVQSFLWFASGKPQSVELVLLTYLKNKLTPQEKPSS